MYASRSRPASEPRNREPLESRDRGRLSLDDGRSELSSSSLSLHPSPTFRKVFDRIMDGRLPMGVPRMGSGGEAARRRHEKRLICTRLIAVVGRNRLRSGTSAPRYKT